MTRFEKSPTTFLLSSKCNNHFPGNFRDTSGNFRGCRQLYDEILVVFVITFRYWLFLNYFQDLEAYGSLSSKL